MDDLSKQLSELLEKELIKPLYLKISHEEGGRLTVEQVAFLRSQDLAALIHVEERTIRGWAKKNLIPSFKPPGSSVLLFDLNDVIRALKNGAPVEAGQDRTPGLRIAAP